MKKLSKSTNRAISIVSLSVFIVSLVCLGTISYKLISTYQENLRLKQEYQDILDEAARLEEYDFKVDDNGYYNVYTNGDEMVVYGNGKTIVITIK